jgi:hypothetical protein
VIAIGLLLHLTRTSPDTAELRLAVREALVAVYVKAKASSEHIYFNRQSMEKALGLGNTPALGEVTSIFEGRGTEDRNVRCGDRSCVAFGIGPIRKNGDSLTVIVLVDQAYDARRSYETGYTVTLVWTGLRYMVRGVAVSSRT